MLNYLCVHACGLRSSSSLLSGEVPITLVSVSVPSTSPRLASICTDHCVRPVLVAVSLVKNASEEFSLASPGPLPSTLCAALQRQRRNRPASHTCIRDKR